MRIDRNGLRWTLAGAVFGVSLISILSIGWFLLPVAVGLAGWAGARGNGRGSYGVVVGAGLAVAAICLPQAPFARIGLAGVALALAGVAGCLVAHRHRPA
jgi:hypothetical protein